MIELPERTRPRYSAVLYFLGQYKAQYAGVLVLILVSSVLESVSVVAVFPLLSSLLGESPQKATGILGLMNRVVDILPIDNRTVAASVLIIIAFSGKVLLGLSRDIAISYVSAGVLYDVKKQLMERYADAHYQVHLDSKQGILLYNTLSTPSAVHSILMAGSRMLASMGKVVSITAVLLTILPLAAAAFAVLGIVYYGGIQYLSRRISFYLGERRARARTEQTIIINEFFSGFHQIVSFGSVKKWVDRFDQESTRDRRLLVQSQVWQAIPRPIMEFSALALLLGFVSVLTLTRSDAANLASLGVFAVALVQLIPSLTSIGSTWMGLMNSLPDAERAHEVITGPLVVRGNGSREVGAFEHSIAFENVSFRYPSRDTLFQDANLTFKKGRVTAIVGASGAGKTTLVNLILGLFQPTGGRILVDGVTLQELEHLSWLSKIGFVSQEPFTSHSSVVDNIRFGRDGYSMEEVIGAAKIANADGFISELPEGYETVVGERGLKLSGGQQQRIAIARAVLGGPDILLFDEATSSLDTLSESQVQEAIDQVSTDRTVIIIAHRLSTIKNADKIIVLANGRVVEEGNHQELLEKNGHYSRLTASSR